MRASHLQPWSPRRLHPDASRPANMSAPKWWAPLASKWGLMGLLIFVGLMMGLWDSARHAMAPRSGTLAKSESPIAAANARRH
jgi:hypothetical protein